MKMLQPKRKMNSGKNLRDITEAQNGRIVILEDFNGELRQIPNEVTEAVGALQEQ